MKLGKKFIFGLAMVGLTEFSLINVAFSDDKKGEYGGYVSDEESRFKGYVWDFVDEIANDDKGITDFDHVSGANNDNFTRAQYYWGSCSQLTSEADSYVDSVDMAYVAGHGSPSEITMSSSEDSCNFTETSWGNNDLETIIFHSCKVLEMGADYWKRWVVTEENPNRPFSGLHQVCGFKTNHNNGIDAGAWAADEFAENLDDNYSIRYGWYEAVEDAYWLSPYAVVANGLNKQAVFYIKPNKDETMQESQIYGKDVKFGNKNYVFYAYSRK